ncbi:hypothetical protein P344_03765 [Spiroplasma mirum ATCC 29335]|uniref:Uncharacterized protein n=1 Tax=Spiroplasma mirum ATCC 29335 TaxID=838561 RepID=W0GQZ9_9MOLU|nr:MULTISPECIES: ABC transporter permease [Spiroplasma]AHF61059.1 putative ABC-type amino acid transport system permease protein [Spiroplasma mirum ATCC 29335]AHI58093.1 hypothetical protein P344_03765 [Spiroplasma mirum ATCC 29335]AKM53156.1 hypothetical protein SATRI_v1c06970 [Spiroplasma atrichopogonis]
MRLFRILLHHFFHKSNVFYLSVLFGYPLLIVIVACSLNADFPITLPTYISVGIILATVIVLPNFLIQYRKIEFIYRLKATTMNIYWIIANICLFFLFIVLLITIWMFLWAMIFPQQRMLVKTINWGIFILGIFLTTTMGIAIGFCAGGIFKSNSVSLIIMFSMFIIPLYLGGVTIPLDIIYNKAPWLFYLTLAIPFKYPVSILQLAWGGDINGMKVISSTGHLINVGFPNIWIGIIVSLAVSGLLIFLGIKFFRLR